MTDKVKALILTLDQDIREDDIQSLVQALRWMRHVIDVAPVMANIDGYIAHTRALMEIENKLLDVLRVESQQ